MIFHKKIENAYKSQMYSRCDDKGLVYYFSHQDFPNLYATEYCFNSSLGHKLKGNFYYYPNYDDSKLIIFDHGFGGGHLSYMKEIEKLCSAGFRVLAYDHTGCMASGGTGARGFTQSLHDLDDCLKSIKNDFDLNKIDIYVMGHSWGGFATLNISALHSDVKKVVVLSGFVSVKKIIEQNFKGLLKGYQKHILNLETESNPDYVRFDAVESLKKSNVNALLIYSDNDHLVNKEIHFDYLQKGLIDCSNVKLVLVSEKGHNPNYTISAVQYLKELTIKTKDAEKLKTQEEKEKFKNSFDWNKMTEQDNEVWDNIITFLKE